MFWQVYQKKTVNSPQDLLGHNMFYISGAYMVTNIAHSARLQVMQASADAAFDDQATLNIAYSNKNTNTPSHSYNLRSSD